MNPYRNWRRVVYLAGAATISALTLLILLTMLGCLVGWFGGASGGSSSGY